MGLLNKCSLVQLEVQPHPNGQEYSSKYYTGVFTTVPEVIVCGVNVFSTWSNRVRDEGKLDGSWRFMALASHYIKVTKIKV